MGDCTTRSAKAQPGERKHNQAFGLLRPAFGRPPASQTAALGSQTAALESQAATLGFHTAAVGFHTVALGFQTSALGFHTAAAGFHTAALGFQTVARGFQTAVLQFGPPRIRTALMRSGQQAWICARLFLLQVCLNVQCCEHPFILRGNVRDFLQISTFCESIFHESECPWRKFS